MKVVKEGAPALVAAVERGEVSVSAASEVATLSKPEQVEIVARQSINFRTSRAQPATRIASGCSNRRMVSAAVVNRSAASNISHCSGLAISRPYR